MRLFRIALGLVLAAGTSRALFSGWLPRLYEEPRFFFTWPLLDFVRPLPSPGMHVLYALLTALGLAIAAGFHTRVAAALFCAGFTYTQLIDVTNYLNHHYLVTLLTFLLAVLPDRPWSVLVLRFQVGVVYFFAGLAKLGGDWLLDGQPLRAWLAARTHTPLVGPYLDDPGVALALSWCGFLFDTTIALWLSWRKTRLPAYLVLLCFHGLTGYWFNIGMFPFIMSAAALIFFAPVPPRPWGIPRLAIAWCVVQLLIPLRHLAYPGDVLWTEEGMRFAWKVMVREKHGSVTFHARDRASGRAVEVPARRYLTAKQEREMAAQPDLILALARRIGRDLGDAEVRAEAWVSLNGRPKRLLLDPTRDLTRVDDDLWPKPWILPGGRP